MDRYVVLCDCDGGQQPREIAYIDDDRSNGGRIHVEPNPSKPYGIGTRVAPTRRGEFRTSIILDCPRCERRVRITELTAAQIIDLLGPVRDRLETALVAGWFDEFPVARLVIPFVQSNPPVPSLCYIVSKRFGKRR